MRSRTLINNKYYETFYQSPFRVGAKRTAPIAGSLKCRKCRPTRSADWCSQGASSPAPSFINPLDPTSGSAPEPTYFIISAAPPSAVSQLCIHSTVSPLHLVRLSTPAVPTFSPFADPSDWLPFILVRHPTFIHNTKLRLNLASTPYSSQHHYLTLPHCIQPAQETTSLDLPYFHTSILGQQNENCLHRHPRIHPAFHRGCAP